MLVFDPEYAAAQGYPTSVLNGLLNTLIVIGIVVGLQMVGVVLMAAMVVAPASAARQWTDRLGLMVVLAAFFGALSGVGGAMISAAGRGLATGPVIVLFVTALVGISLLFAPNRGLLWDWLRQRRTRAELGRARVLEALYLLGLSHNNPIRPHPQRSLELALPALNVGQALETLAEEGAVVRQNGTQWALTEAGQARVVEHLRSTHSDSRRMLAQGDRA